MNGPDNLPARAIAVEGMSLLKRMLELGNFHVDKDHLQMLYRTRRLV